MAAALTLGACSQDETAGGDGALSPMELTATGLESMVTPMTRATVDGNWEGVTKVAVKVGSDVKEYTVTADATDNTKGKLTSTDPFYWPASGSETTVSAWWSYNEADITTKPAVVVKSDQSGEGYAASDFIEAVDQKVTKVNPMLVFEHRTAKICVKLKAADGTTALTGAVVSIVVGGQTVVEKCYNENSSNEHLALIAPTAAAEELTVKIAAEGKNYVYKYTPTEGYAANCQYTFNLKVMNGEAVALSGCTITGWTDKLTVNDGEAEEDLGFTKDIDGTYHVTSAAGLKAWAETVASSSNQYVSCVLENDIVMPAVADGESNWTPISHFCGTFDGSGKTITGLVVNKTESHAGFIVWNDGTVKNLTLKDAKITSYGYVGAVAVINNGSTIENCHVTGTSVITGGNGNQVGGVVSMNNGTILACHVAKGCEVSGTTMVGGIAGENNSNITGCYALCSLTGMRMVGGICGQVNGGSLTACYSKCSYSLGTNIGGIVGNIPDTSSTTEFSACYWQGDNYCGSGVGSAMTDPSGMTKIEGETSWATACGEMNTALEGTGYEYVENGDASTSADEPLMLRRKQ